MVSSFPAFLAIFGADTWLTNLICILVGLSAIYAFVLLKPLSDDRTYHATASR